MNGIRWSAARSACVLVLLAVSCGGDSSGPAKAGPPAALTVVTGTAQQGESGEVLATPLTVKVADAQARPVANAVVTFVVAAGGGTLSQASDTTDTEGTASVRWTMGSTLGDARVEARVTGLVTPAVFTATVKAGPPTAATQVSAAVGSSAGGFDVTDSVSIRVLDRFQHPVAGTTVTFAVTSGGGTVSSATRTTGDDGVARTAWKLGAAGPQLLRATAGGVSVDVQGTAVACEEKTLAIGDVVSISPATSSMCMVTNSSGTQKYLVTVSNSNSTPASTTSFRLRGAGGSAASASVALDGAIRHTAGLSAARAAEVEAVQAGMRAHSDLLRANTELLERLGPARRAQLRAARNAGTVARQTPPPPNIGDVLSVKIPRNFSNLCQLSSASQIRGRVVYSGSKVVILEDSAAVTAGQIDARYRAIGEEFDNVMFPILTTNFGDPLAMDAQTDQNGRLFMVFSPVVNDLQGGNVAGFVTSGDFFDVGSCPASNFGEYFYARAPTSTGSGIDQDPSTMTADEWARATRTVIIHEVKHITSFAEKFASPIEITNAFFQRDQWLEESSAMIAEELWARTVFGYAKGSNVNYANSIYCEVRPTPNPSWPQCQPLKPLSMLDHFFFLYNYFENPETTSAVGPLAADDFTFYGSGWMFVRWLIDSFAASESAFLTALNKEMTHPGTDNIETRTGRTLAELLSDFALAIALDDYPNFTPKDAKHSLPSWNTRNIYQGLNADFSSQGFFQKVAPLRVRPASLGRFVIDVSSVTGGGFSVFEVSGSSTSKQLLEFRGLSGAGFPADMRVKLVRVQ
jgi:hypothetical protein